MSSTACRRSVSGWPISARRWPTPGCGPACGPATTVRTSPRWRAGTGTRERVPRILTVNVGSTSIKLAEIVDGHIVSTPASFEEAAAPSKAAPDAVAHRIVHGGARTEAELVDDDVVAQLRALTELAPLHQPPALD